MIELKELGFRYGRAGKPLFQGLDLQLPAGTICGMLGANGAGKSSLLRLLAGLSFPQQGSCTVTPAISIGVALAFRLESKQIGPGGGR